MAQNSKHKIQKLIEQLIQNDKYKQHLEKAKKQYKLKPNVLTMRIQQIENYCFAISSKLEINQAWAENELNIFVWLLIGYCYENNKRVHQLVHDDWAFFNQIFTTKSAHELMYQAYLIVRAEGRVRNWANQQVDLIKSIMKQQTISQSKNTNKWTQISKSFFLLSEKKNFRTAKQCRQLWINHLNPNITKEKWTLDEDLKLIQEVEKQKKKWSKVSKQFEGKRTEHMIKNRFKSLCHCELKSRMGLKSKVHEKEIIGSIRDKIMMKIEKERSKTMQQIGFYRNSNQEKYPEMMDIKELPTLSNSKPSIQTQQNLQDQQMAPFLEPQNSASSSNSPSRESSQTSLFFKDLQEPIFDFLQQNESEQEQYFHK